MILSNQINLDIIQGQQLTLQQQQAPVQQLLAEIQHLPVLSENVRQVMRLLDEPDCCFDAMATILAADQALGADVMRLVNSGLYGFRCRISSLRQATTILGLYGIRSLVLSSAVLNLLQSSQPALFDHALLCSRAAASLAREANYTPVDDAATAGLLHDVGLLILIDYLPDAYAEVVDKMRTANCSQLEAEHAVLGLTHASMGAQLLATWKLPASTVAAVAAHHEFDSTTTEPVLSAVVHVADCMASHVVLGWPDGDPPGIAPAALAALGLEMAEVRQLCHFLVAAAD